MSDTIASIMFLNGSSLTTLNLPVLESISAGITAGDNVGLVTVSMPNFLPTDGTNINFVNGALNVASVNHILARCVANAGYVSGTVDLSGGTSAAPTGQGATDVTTLTGRGVTVNTN